MIYELRIYHCMPGRMADLLKRFEDLTMPVWEKHGIRQAGFWSVMVGGSNHDLYYMLAWESMAEREQKWAAVLADDEYFAARAITNANGELVASTSNIMLKPTAFSTVK